MKARGHSLRKSLLLSDKTVSGGTRLSGTRTHNWSNLTTRRHYPGEHRIALLVNGHEVANAVLTLTSSKRQVPELDFLNNILEDDREFRKIGRFSHGHHVENNS